MLRTPLFSPRATCSPLHSPLQVLFWDVRKLSEPTETMLLEDKTASDSRTMGGVSLEYSAGAGPSKFLVGTEQGKVVSCNRKAKNPSDRIGYIYEGHSGPVYALQRNSFFPKFFLTIGDWTVRLWNEDLRSPIMTSKYFKNYLLDATWSPTRPGVFLTTKMDGTLDVWDYFYKQNDPTLSLQARFWLHLHSGFSRHGHALCGLALGHIFGCISTPDSHAMGTLCVASLRR